MVRYNAAALNWCTWL